MNFGASKSAQKNNTFGLNDVGTYCGPAPQKKYTAVKNNAPTGKGHRKVLCPSGRFIHQCDRLGLLRSCGRLVLSFGQSRLEPRGFLGMNQPLGSGLVESLRDFGKRDGRCRGSLGAGFGQRGAELLDESSQGRGL